MSALIVARFTIQEAITRKLVLAAILLSLAFIGLYALGFNFLYTSAADGGQGADRSELILASTLLTVLGLYAVYFLSSFLALFLSVGSISAELDSGTLHAVLARPMRRSAYVLGRWIGFSLLIGLYVAVIAGLLLLVSRVISGYEPPNPAATMALMTLGAILLLTLSLLGSTIFSTLANGVIVFTLFGVAWIGGIIEFIGAVIGNVAMQNLGVVVGLLIPSDAVWRGASYFVQSPVFLSILSGELGQGPGASASAASLPFAGTTPPAPALIVWAVVYVAVSLGFAVLAFSRRDL